MLKSTNYVHHDKKKVLKLDVVFPQKEAKNYNDWIKYISKHISQEEREKILAKSEMLITC